LVICFVQVDNAGATAVTSTVTDSVGSTWTLLGRSNATGGGGSDIWIADAGASPAARTIGITSANGFNQAQAARAAVLVLTGTASRTGQTATAVTGTTQTLNVTTVVGAMVVAGSISITTAQTATAATGCTIVDTLSSTASAGMASARSTSTVADTAAHAYGFAGMSGTLRTVAVAILPAAATTSTPTKVKQQSFTPMIRASFI
jgi:hypothetical protein